MNPTVLAFLVLYYLVVLGIGYWAVRRGAGEDLEGYLLGGRKIGPFTTALTLQSTAMSGYMFLGAGSAGYAHGYWACWYAAGDIGGGMMNLSVIGRRMRKLSQIFGALTSIEYLEARYPHPFLRLYSAVMAIFFLMFYVLAQFIAGGKGMEIVTGLPYWAALLIAVGVIICYTFMGGYFAVAYTDLFQSLVMLFGMIWIFAATLSAVGGWSTANAALAQMDPTLLSTWGRGLEFQGKWGLVAGAVLVFSIGYMGWPHVVTRNLAMNDPKSARTAGVYSVLWNLFFVTTPYLIGIFAIVLFPKLADPELAIMKVATELLPPAVTGIVMAAIMAAIMSTADSLLLQTGTFASRDIYQRFLNKNANESQMVWVSRALVLAIGIVGYFVALLKPPSVFSIVIFATSVFGSAFLPVNFCAVWWKKANVPGAMSSIIGGSITAIVWQMAGLDGVTAVHPMFAGTIVSTVLIVAVSLLTQQIAPVPDHILAAMDETAKLGPIPKKMIMGADHRISSEASQIGKILGASEG